MIKWQVTKPRITMIRLLKCNHKTILKSRGLNLPVGKNSKESNYLIPYNHCYSFVCCCFCFSMSNNKKTRKGIKYLN